MAITTDVVFWIDHDSGSDAARTAQTLSVASNPSGSITRITKAGHGLTTGEIVDLTAFSTWLNGAWKITVVDADSYDLDGAVWQTTADATGNCTPRGGKLSDPWKTITSGATAARLGGMTGVNFDVRHKKTADPVSLSQNATLTNGSRTGTLTTALTFLLDNFETAWTADTNVATTTSTTRKQGSQACSVATNGSFTTGPMCYKDYGSAIDLSAYTGITFQLRCATTAITANTLQIRMYSDAGRTTLVETLQIPAISATGVYCPITILKGSALSASVRVIELYANATQTSKTFLIDNISACTTAFHLLHMVGLDDGLWMTMDWISVTDFGISSTPNGLPTAGYGWPKDTTTTTLYTRLPYVPTDGGTTSTAAINTINLGGGDVTHRAKFSFGWDLSTQTQDGETWFDGLIGNGYCISTASSIKYIDVVLCCAVRCNLLGYANTSVQDMYFYDCKCTAAGNSSSALFSSVATANYKFLFDGCISFGGSSAFRSDGTCSVDFIDCEFYSSLSYIFNFIQNSNITAKNCTMRGLPSGASGVGIATSYKVNFISCSFADFPSGYGVNSNSGSVIVLLSCSFTAITYKLYASTQGRIIAANCQFDSLTNLATFPSTSEIYLGRIFIHNTDEVENDHRIYHSMGTVITDATAHDGTAAFRWKMMPILAYPAVGDTFPLEFEIHKCVCVANVAQTIKVNAWRSNTGLSIGIRVKEANLTGITTTTALCTANANTKQELTLTFTPTQSGVITIWGVAWGGTTYSGWLADLTPMANQSTKALTTAFGGQPFSSNSGEAGGGGATSIPCFISVG